MNRLYKYLYLVCKSVYYEPTFQIALSRLEPRGKTESNLHKLEVYLADNSNPFYTVKDSIFHIIVDTRISRFRESINVLEQSPYYIGRYQYGHLWSNKCVILLKHPVPRQWKAFLNSQYSKIYRHSDNSVFFINNDEVVQSHYREVDRATGRIQMTKEWHCMMKTESYFNKYIAPLASGLSKEEIETIKKENEYDDIINFEDETFTSLEHIKIPEKNNILELI